MRFGRLILLLAACDLGAQTKSSPADVVYARCKPSVVSILTFDASRALLGQGSGFIVARNQIVTNYHVIDGSSTATVVFSDGSMTAITALIAASGPKDLVILEAETGTRPSLVLGDELQLKVGETVYAIGTPQGLSGSFSSGLVSAFRQDEGEFGIQITTVIAPGSSGGPLLNAQGQVVDVATLQLDKTEFGFAMGAGDVKRLLKAPLEVKLKLSDLFPERPVTAVDEVGPVRDVVDKKKYDEAQASFDLLSATAKSGFDGRLVLCRLRVHWNKYQDAMEACNAAIKLRPKEGEPYRYAAYSEFRLGDKQRAEEAAAKAIELSNDAYSRKLLGLIHYSEEKYELVAKELSVDSEDKDVLILLTGAAYHNHDFGSFQRLGTRVTGLKGPNNGWSFFVKAVNAERELDWNTALDKYRECDADTDFVDPICIIGVARIERIGTSYEKALTDLESALTRYPQNHSALSEAIFINLLLRNGAEADRLHALMQAGERTDEDDAADCIYYYGRNQPRSATTHCQDAIRQNEHSYAAWSNAGYVALDNNEFQSAVSYFSKALDLFEESKTKHTALEDVSLCWGRIIAYYYSGDKKGAKTIYRWAKKNYREYVTFSALKQLPLVWSDTTLKLLSKAIADLK